MKIKDCQRIYYQNTKIQKIYNKDQVIYEYNPSLTMTYLDRNKYLNFIKNAPSGKTKIISFFTEESFMQYDTSNQNCITVKDIGKNNTGVIGKIYTNSTRTEYYIYIIGYGYGITLPFDISNFFSRFTGVTDILFNSCTTIDNTEPVNLTSLFKNCQNLILTDFFTRFNLSSISSSIKEMFYDCQKLTNINLNNINLSNVTDFTDAFYNCKSLVNFNQNNFLNDVIFNPSKISSLNLTRAFKGAKIEIDIDFSSTTTTPLNNYYKIDEAFVNSILGEVNFSGLTLNYTTQNKNLYYRLLYEATIENLLLENCYLGSINPDNRAMCFNFIYYYEMLDKTQITNLSLKNTTLQSAYLRMVYGYGSDVQLDTYLPWYSINNQINLDNFYIEDKWSRWISPEQSDEDEWGNLELTNEKKISNFGCEFSTLVFI